MIETMVKHFHEIFIRKRIVDLHLLIVTPRIAEILATNRERIAGIIMIKGKHQEVPVAIEIDLQGTIGVHLKIFFVCGVGLQISTEQKIARDIRITASKDTQWEYCNRTKGKPSKSSTK